MPLMGSGKAVKGQGVAKGQIKKTPLDAPVKGKGAYDGQSCEEWRLMPKL